MISIVDTSGTNGFVSISSSTINTSCSSGIYISGGTISITNSTVTNNTLYGVNAVALTGSSITIAGSQFTFNGAAGFYVTGTQQSQLIVDHSVFASNTLEGLNCAVTGVRRVEIKVHCTSPLT